MSWSCRGPYSLIHACCTVPPKQFFPPDVFPILRVWWPIWGRGAGAREGQSFVEDQVTCDEQSSSSIDRVVAVAIAVVAVDVIVCHPGGLLQRGYGGVPVLHE